MTATKNNERKGFGKMKHGVYDDLSPERQEKDPLRYNSTSTDRLEKAKEHTEMTLSEQLKWFKTFRSQGNKKQREHYKHMLKVVHAKLSKREIYVTK